jgi:microcompartment protein CcmK/EutM
VVSFTSTYVFKPLRNCLAKNCAKTATTTYRLLLALASRATLDSQSRGIQDHILLSEGSGSLQTHHYPSRLSNGRDLMQKLTAKLLMVLASTVNLGSKFHGTQNHILLSDGSESRSGAKSQSQSQS